MTTTNQRNTNVVKVLKGLATAQFASGVKVKGITFMKGATQIAGLEMDVAEMTANQLMGLPGVGPSISTKSIEIAVRGTCPAWEQVRVSVESAFSWDDAKVSWVRKAA